MAEAVFVRVGGADGLVRFPARSCSLFCRREPLCTSLQTHPYSCDEVILRFFGEIRTVSSHIGDVTRLVEFLRAMPIVREGESPRRVDAAC